MTEHRLSLPPDFDFQACLVFLGRSDKEVLHRVEDGALIRPFRTESGLDLLEIRAEGNALLVRKLAGSNGPISPNALAEIREIFDLDRDLAPFYAQMAADPVMAPLVAQYCGLRLIRIPDLFEALSWTIIGQQINLGFAYRMKARLVAECGPSVTWQGRHWYSFPDPADVAQIAPGRLREMQYSRQKSDYLLGLARHMAAGNLSRDALEQQGGFAAMEAELLALRGIGPWSASYTMMKCLGAADAFPIGDAGLHNALKRQLNLERKPGVAHIRKLATGWQGWRGYATFYLWRSLMSI